VQGISAFGKLSDPDSPLYLLFHLMSGNSSVGRRPPVSPHSIMAVSLSGFVKYAHVAQSAEHFLGKEEVMGPIPIVGFEDRQFQPVKYRAGWNGAANGEI
jgi:hypothetical protein